jgi:hypothetical protein
MAYVGLGAGRDHRGVNAYIAHLDGVVGSVQAHGAVIAGKAKANLAAHRDTGAAYIDMDREDTDAIISLVDEAAITIEYGREEGIDRTGRPKGAMQGLHILGRAAGI